MYNLHSCQILGIFNDSSWNIKTIKTSFQILRIFRSYRNSLRTSLLSPPLLLTFQYLQQKLEFFLRTCFRFRLRKQLQFILFQRPNCLVETLGSQRYHLVNFFSTDFSILEKNYVLVFRQSMPSFFTELVEAFRALKYFVFLCWDSIIQPSQFFRMISPKPVRTRQAFSKNFAKSKPKKCNSAALLD